MKVFLSWSGKRSKALAVALKEWLPLILQYVEPWVSDKDITAGERWAQAIGGELESSNFGILCVTPENLNSEWILFEAGALSKSMLDAKVIPLLFGLELSDLSGPLSQFQALKVDEPGLMAVVKAINAVAENKAAEATINLLVPALWPQLQQKIADIPDEEPSGKHARPQSDILEELVSEVRGLGVKMRNVDPDLADKEYRYFNRTIREFDPRMLDDLMHLMSDSRDGEMLLLLVAGMVRDIMPWLAEVFVESYRELKTAGPEEVELIGNRLNRVIHLTTRSRFGDRLMMRSKAMHILMRELPHFVDRAISRRAELRPSILESTSEEIDKDDT